MIALLADIHANLEALEACLAHARAAGATRYALLGDIVGYGADPGAVVDIAARLVDDGAIAVQGNHDEAILRSGGYMNETAKAAIEWTKRRLDERQKRFLAELPLTARSGECLFVHASAHRPERWDYVDGPGAARLSIDAAGAPYTVSGHIHDQRLYFDTGNARVGAFHPTPGSPIPVSPRHRWLAIAGSVGQSRDADPRAAYALLDTAQKRITFHRVAYDHVAVAGKMQRAGLPAALVHRMQRGI